MEIFKYLVAVLTDKRVVLIFRLVLGMTFVYASLDKIAHPDQFAKIIYNYKILPDFLINVFAVTLPWIELLAGLFLILGIFTESASLLISFLLVIFLFAISVNVLRGVDLNCGCFSTDPAGKKEGISLLFKDFLFLFMGFMVFFFNKGFATISSLYRRKSSEL
ncbi:MAG: DoxX family membrane protein [candidate division Zixibacteria bacterium]|nr:DoxX family membrane protein [candidate division Zixibacteria bacterium]